MKAVMIIYNQAHSEKVEYILDKLGIKGYLPLGECPGTGKQGWSSASRNSCLAGDK